MTKQGLVITLLAVVVALFVLGQNGQPSTLQLIQYQPTIISR